MHTPETHAPSQPARLSLLEHTAIEICIIPKSRADPPRFRPYFIVLVVVISNRKLPATHKGIAVTPTTLELYSRSARSQKNYFITLYTRVKWNAVLAIVIVEVGAEPTFAE